MKIVIKKDLFNISKRLKKINREFILCYNRSRQVYEVCLKDSLHIFLTLPYKVLDLNCLTYVYERLKKSNEEILEEVEKYNFSREHKLMQKQKENALKKAENILKELK